MSGLAATSQLSCVPLVVPVLSWLFGRRNSRELFPVRPRPTAACALASVSSSSSPPTVGGLNWDLRAQPSSQSFSSYGSILPTSLAYIVPSTRGCSPWRPDAVMNATGRGGTFGPRIFKGAGNARTPRRRGALPAAGPYLRLSVSGGQAVKQKR
ncbi:hypothetical protein Bca52824_016896 [Brassica carinata]|uniref:Uncharacterized protein n=1 Tax=Brassica carinata TaxID=52824 RepID=A0A8X7VM63_BRACI|nr:hypothetical protein Bca52824_016896 [Brassica carinata]